MSTSVGVDGGRVRSRGPPSVDLAQLRVMGADYVHEWTKEHGQLPCTSVTIPLDRINFDSALAVVSDPKYSGLFGDVRHLVVQNTTTMDLSEQEALYARVGDLVRAFPRVSDLQLKVAAIGVDIGAFLDKVDKLVQLERLEFRAWSDASPSSRLHNLELLSAFVERRRADPAKTNLARLTVMPSLIPLADRKNKAAYDAFCSRTEGCACFRIQGRYANPIC